MAQVIVAQRMWQRRDTAANWTAKNPIMAAGEIGVQLGALPTDTKFKIGDGVTAWNTLGFYEGRLIELGTGAGYIRWRYVGDPTWTNLVSLASLQGPTGATGPAGAAGLSAYQVAVANGFAGTQAQWLESLVGEDGATGPQGPPGIPSERRILVVPNTDTGSFACDWDAYDEIRVTLTANTTFSFSGALDGQGCVLKVKQDVVGGRTVSFGAEVRFNSLITIFNATATAGKADKVGFVYDGTDSYYDFVSVVPGI